MLETFATALARAAADPVRDGPGGARGATRGRRGHASRCPTSTTSWSTWSRSGWRTRRGLLRRRPTVRADRGDRPACVGPAGGRTAPARTVRLRRPAHPDDVRRRDRPAADRRRRRRTHRRPDRACSSPRAVRQRRAPPSCRPSDCRSSGRSCRWCRGSRSRRCRRWLPLIADDGQDGLRASSAPSSSPPAIGLAISPSSPRSSASSRRRDRPIITVIGLSLMPVAAGWITGQPMSAVSRTRPSLDPGNIGLAVLHPAVVLVLTSSRGCPGCRSCSASSSARSSRDRRQGQLRRCRRLGDRVALPRRSRSARRRSRSARSSR